MARSPHRARETTTMNQRVTLPSAVAQVFITDQLYDRAPPVPDHLREKLAI
jgi:hypothetical protein